MGEFRSTKGASSHILGRLGRDTLRPAWGVAVNLFILALIIELLGLDWWEPA